MDKNIKNILDDLYAIDSSLKKYEKDLVQVIEKLIAAKPNLKFDDNFKSKLRAELLEKFGQTENKKLNFNFMNKIIYAVGALVLVLVVLIPSLLSNKTTNTSGDNLLAKVDFGLEIKQLRSGAFGSLSVQNPVSPEESAAAGFGGGGGMGVTNADAKMIMPYEPIVYKYVYKGEDFSIDGEQMAVLKKVRGMGSQSDAARILQSMNFDNIDLSSFNNAKLRNFTVYEDKDYGYSAYVDLYEGMISINEYWERWPMYQNYPQNPITLNDVPSDDKLIAMANKFLADRNISTDGYGEPVVDNSWKQAYARMENKADFTVPDTATIVYPTVVDGKEVYEEWGNVQGLRVSINLRYNRVMNMWNLTNNKYESSLYDMETNIDRILELASNGGSMYYPMPDENQAKVVEITMGTPRIVYVQTWYYEDNMSSQLFVPALLFPITNIPDEADYFYRENVVVPLAKDIINDRILPQPEPLLEIK